MISLYIIGTGCILASIFMPPKEAKVRRLITFTLMGSAILAVLPWPGLRFAGLMVFLAGTLAFGISTLLRKDLSTMDRLLQIPLPLFLLLHLAFSRFELPGAEIVRFGLLIGIGAFLYMGFNMKRYIKEFGPVAILYSVSLFEFLSLFL